MRVHEQSQTQILFSLMSTVCHTVLQPLNLKNNNIDTTEEWVGTLLWKVGDGEKTDDGNGMLYLISLQQNKHTLRFLICHACYQYFLFCLLEAQCGMFYYHH